MPGSSSKGRRSDPRQSGRSGAGRGGRSGSGQRGAKPPPRSGGNRGGSTERQGRAPAGKVAATAKAPRRDLKGPARDLPRWIVDALTRVTPRSRVSAALESLGEASAALSDGRFRAAQRFARSAKELSPRDATVREVLGIASYRLGDWGTALRELRTYRRLSGEPTHLPVEMDILRAMGRHPDVEEAWNQLERLDAAPTVIKEGRVIYASFLMDEGRTAEARRVVTPRSLSSTPRPEDLRLWYVAARGAALEGDQEEAARLRNAILVMDPGFPGIDELDRVISSSPGPT